jgi:hypothetical protein
MSNIFQFLATRDPQMNFRWQAFRTMEAFGVDERLVERFSIPWARFESVPIYVQGSNQYYHSVNDHDPMSITFYVDKDLTSINALIDWSKLVHENGRYGLPAKYKKTFGANLLANHDDTPIGTFLAEGAWPSAFDDLELTYNESGRLTFTATITVDKITFYTGSGSSGTRTSGGMDASVRYNGNSGASNTASTGNSGLDRGYAA